MINDRYYELVRREPFPGTTIALPGDYAEMDAPIRLIKYPNISPGAAVFTSRDTTCNVMIQLLNPPVPKEEFREFVAQNKKIICFQLPSMTVTRDLCQLERADLLFYWFSYQIPCMDSDCYNEMYYGCFRNHVLLLNFNCPDSEGEEMKELFGKIAGSITDKEAL